jgi:hypothetical protein
MGYQLHRMPGVLVAMLNFDPCNTGLPTLLRLCLSMSFRLKLNYLFFLTAIAFSMHPLTGYIPSGKYCSRCLLPVTLIPFLMQCIVLATVPGYPAAVRVWNRTGCSSPGCYPENRGTHRVRGRVGTGPRFHFTVLTTLAPIKYLSSDRIVTWSIREMCRLMPYFISRSQICDRISMHRVAVKLSPKSRQNDRVFIPTPWQLVRLQIGEQEMKEGMKLHISRIDYVTIWSELKYLIGVRNVDFGGAGFVWKPVATVRFRVETRPGTEPLIWTRC